MKLCKDCMYFAEVHPTDPRGARCHNPKAPAPVDLVYGFKHWTGAVVVRTAGAQCGADAKWFEPKTQPRAAPWWRAFR